MPLLWLRTKNSKAREREKKKSLILFQHRGAVQFVTQSSSIESLVAKFWDAIAGIFAAVIFSVPPRFPWHTPQLNPQSVEFKSRVTFSISYLCTYLIYHTKTVILQGACMHREEVFFIYILQDIKKNVSEVKCCWSLGHAETVGESFWIN